VKDTTKQVSEMDYHSVG